MENALLQLAETAALDLYDSEPGPVDFDELQRAMKALASAVQERCAMVADVWGATKPVSGELAPVIATVVSDAGNKIAERIRAL